MKFKIEKGRIEPILSILTKVSVSKKSSFMEKDSLFVEVKDGKLILKAYDGYEIYIESCMPIGDKFYEVGVARFDSKIFSHIVKGLDGDILVEDDDKRCTICNRKTRIEMHSSTINKQLSNLNIAKVDSKYSEFIIKGDVLKESLEAVSVAAGKDINKPDLMNIMLECRRDLITFISTDGYRLVKIDEGCKSSESFNGKDSVLLPSTSIPLLLGFLKNKRDICMRVGEEAIYFDLGNVKMHIRRGDHTKYPNIEKILERESGVLVDVNRSSIVRAIDQIRSVGGDLIILESGYGVDANKMTVKSKGDLVDKRAMGCEVFLNISKEEPLDFNIPFRTSLIYEGLKIMKSEMVRMRIKSDRDFVVIRSKEKSNMLYLVIPCIL